MPLESVGPLRFGMTMAEVVAAVPSAVELRRFVADPFADVVGIQFGFPALYAYFDRSGQLFCVAADAVSGPQLVLDGMALTGGNPSELEQWLFDRGGLRYGPRANPGIDSLGLVMRVQLTAGGLQTRPVLVGRNWADRCTDDWEGAIPECEWVGHLWPDLRYPERAKTWPPT